MNRECRNCEYCEAVLFQRYASCPFYRNDHPLLSWHCKHFRPYTEKGEGKTDCSIVQTHLEKRIKALEEIAENVLPEMREIERRLSKLDGKHVALEESLGHICSGWANMIDDRIERLERK